MPLASSGMAEFRYDPKEIEPRWQALWAEEGTWEVSNEAGTQVPKSYVLEMLPYPSGGTGGGRSRSRLAWPRGDARRS